MPKQIGHSKALRPSAKTNRRAEPQQGDPIVEPNTSQLQDGSGPGRPAPALSDLGRYCASVLAVTAIESGLDEAGLRSLFARCAQAGYGFPPECEAAVLAEHAALKAS
jgi:hypothetical protein